MKLTVSGTLEFTLDEEAPPARLLFNVTHAGITYSDIHMLILPNDHKVTASIQPVDSRGNPAAIDGLAAWSSSSPDIANITAISADSLSADIVPAGTSLGTCQVNVTADADLGSGVTTIRGVLDVEVVAGQAVGFVISTAPPVPITK